MTRTPQNTELTHDTIVDILRERNFKRLRLLLRDAELGDIAEASEHLDTQTLATTFRMMPRSRRPKFFAELSSDQQQALMEELPQIFVIAVLNQMESDDRTAFLETLEPELRDELLLELDPEERRMAWKLLSYPEESVGRLMIPECISLRAHLLVREALGHLQGFPSLPVEYLHTLFVIDDEDKLIGEVSLAALVTHGAQELRVGDIMRKSVIALDPYQNEGEAVEVFRKYDRPYIPVTDAENNIIGLVTVDDIFDVAEEEATEDIQAFGGQGALEDSYFHTPYFTLIQKRLGWLAILFIGGFFAAEALRTYEVVLEKWKFLIFMMPIITSAGGNSGTQTASLIIRGIAIKEMDQNDVWRILKREILIGLVLGMVLAALGIVRVLSWGLAYQVGIIVGTSVIAVVVLGVVMGSMLPFIFRRIGLDPAVVSSPFISTLMDVTSIAIYVNVTFWIMGV